MALPLACCATSDVALRCGSLDARIDHSADTKAQALALRRVAFRKGQRADEDTFDDACVHSVVRDVTADTTLIAFRLRLLPVADDLHRAYSAGFYDLTPLARDPGPWLEVGRFCQSPAGTNTNALMLAWAAIGLYVDRHGVAMLFGSSSFDGAEPSRHAGSLSRLRAYHLGDARLIPGRVSKHAVGFPVQCNALAPLPPLMRSYLSMGGWVGDHAVQDFDLDTLHVFTGLHVSDIPARRKQKLRAMAQAGQRPLDLAAAAQ